MKMMMKLGLLKTPMRPNKHKYKQLKLPKVKLKQWQVQVKWPPCNRKQLAKRMMKKTVMIKKFQVHIIQPSSLI